MPTDSQLTMPTVVIAVLTYRRPGSLTRLLTELDAMRARSPFPRVLVVDNSPDASAQPICPAWATHVHEPTPGIAAARSTALTAAGDADLLAFIDDDEIPHEQWLSALVRTWQTFDRPAGVAGRVVPRFLATPPPWIVAGGFFDRTRRPTGQLVAAAGAGNLLLDLHQVRSLGVSFDTSRGMAAGEDTLFTRQITQAGGRIVWCDDAVVDDEVPADRLTARWLQQRWWSHGTASAAIDLRLAPTSARRRARRLTLAATGLARIPAGLGVMAFGGLARNPGRAARGARLAVRGAALVAGAWGVGYAEYGRPSAALSASEPAAPRGSDGTCEAHDPTRGGDAP